jgi:L-fucose isomerase
MTHIKNEPRNTLVGRMPKIGIRPTIDGRRMGVRESLKTHRHAASSSLISSTPHPMPAVVCHPELASARR